MERLNLLKDTQGELESMDGAVDDWGECKEEEEVSMSEK